MRVPGWMDGWGGVGLVDDDETVAMGSFARAKHEKQQGQEKSLPESFARSCKKFHTCLDARNGILLENYFYLHNSTLVDFSAPRLSLPEVISRFSFRPHAF